MTERYLDPTNDVAFKKIFMDEYKLRDFLNAVLRLPEGSRIEELAFLPQEEVPDIGQGKRSMFDIKCRDEKGNWFIIEMQNGRKPHFLKRVQFYGSHTYVSQLKTGTLHSGLMPVIVVVVLRESLFPEDVEYISYHRTKEEKTNKQHLFELSYVFIELNKFTKKKEELKTTEDYWLDFLANSTSERAPPEKLDDPHVLAAYEAIERFNWTQESFDAYLKARLLAEAEAIALDEKFERGVEKGKAQGKIEAVINLLKHGKLNDSEICQAMHLSADELARLKRQHKL
jgi:predicted transposase/invertase (TIGR01784 family)